MIVDAPLGYPRVADSTLRFVGGARAERGSQRAVAFFAEAGGCQGRRLPIYSLVEEAKCSQKPKAGANAVREIPYHLVACLPPPAPGARRVRPAGPQEPPARLPRGRPAATLHRRSTQRGRDDARTAPTRRARTTPTASRRRRRPPTPRALPRDGDQRDPSPGTPASCRPPSTTYEAISQARPHGLAQLSPVGYAHVNPQGRYRFDKRPSRWSASAATKAHPRFRAGSSSSPADPGQRRQTLSDATRAGC